jgi:hypothetical protein
MIRVSRESGKRRQSDEELPLLMILTDRTAKRQTNFESRTSYWEANGAYSLGSAPPA